MKQWIVKLGFAVALLVAGYISGHYSLPVVHAKSPSTIPKAWGHCVGSVAGVDLILEDGNGTIRFVDVTTGKEDPQVGELFRSGN
jgi:hypothetical protein